MKSIERGVLLGLAVIAVAMAFNASPAFAADKPNIILILSDDFGYGDSGPYGGGPGRGMPTPNSGLNLVREFYPSLVRFYRNKVLTSPTPKAALTAAPKK
jgi:arylsulfatase A-like enzyme